MKAERSNRVKRVLLSLRHWSLSLFNLQRSSVTVQPGRKAQEQPLRDVFCRCPEFVSPVSGVLSGFGAPLWLLEPTEAMRLPQLNTCHPAPLHTHTSGKERERSKVFFRLYSSDLTCLNNTKSHFMRGLVALFLLTANVTCTGSPLVSPLGRFQTQKLNFHSLSSLNADWSTQKLPLFLLDSPTQGVGPCISGGSAADCAPRPTKKTPHKILQNNQTNRHFSTQKISWSHNKVE